jgi:hypothetical protein
VRGERALRRRRGRRWLAIAREQLLLEPPGEVAQHLARDVLHDPAPELGGAPGDGEVGLRDDARAPAEVLEPVGDHGLRGALALLLLGGGRHARGVGVLVDLLQAHRALVGRRHRTELHLHGAAIDAVLAARLHGRPRKAGRDALDVQQDGPRLLDRRVDGELVLQFHPRPLHIAWIVIP